MASSPDIVIAPNLLLNLAGLRRPASKKHPQDKHPSQAGAAFAADLVSDAAAWTSEQELSRALQSTERLNGLLLKKETEEAEKVEQWVNDLLSKQPRLEAKPMACPAERQACIDCLKGSTEGGLQAVLKCSKYVDSYESCVSTALSGTA